MRTYELKIWADESAEKFCAPDLIVTVSEYHGRISVEEAHAYWVWQDRYIPVKAEIVESNDSVMEQIREKLSAQMEREKRNHDNNYDCPEFHDESEAG